MECSKCKASFKNNGALKRHEKTCNLTPELILEVNKLYAAGNSIRELCRMFKTSKNSIFNIIKNPRSLSDACKITRGKYPLKHSEESKKLMREKRLKWMKENPEKTAWRKANLSYPEKKFRDKLKDMELDKKFLIIREKSVFPYFIDFAFENEMVAVEIDGSQHELPERKARDMKKDELLKSKGWRVYRVTAKQVRQNLDFVINDVLDFIGDSKTFKKCGLIEPKNNKKR